MAGVLKPYLLDQHVQPGISGSRATGQTLFHARNRGCEGATCC